MTIEIRELVVRASINSGQKPGPAPESPQADGPTPGPDVAQGIDEALLDEIVERCVARVFNEIAEEKER